MRFGGSKLAFRGVNVDSTAQDVFTEIHSRKIDRKVETAAGSPARRERRGRHCYTDVSAIAFPSGVSCKPSNGFNNSRSSIGNPNRIRTSGFSR